VAATGDGLVNSFEFAHPLDSTDLAHDFSLKPGRIVGFTMEYLDNRTWAGYWPTHPANPQSHWHDIVIASPDSIYPGNLILRGNTVLIVENRRFDINGSIFVTENATLIVRNATLNFTRERESDWNELCLYDPANGRPRLIAEDMMITSPHWVMIELWDNSSATIDNLQCSSLTPGGIPCTGIDASGPQVQLVMSNSGPVSMSATAGSEFELWNCTIDGTFSLHSAKGSVVDSKVGFCPVQQDSELVATNCTFEWGLYASGSSNLTVCDSSSYEHPEYPAMIAYDSSSITFCGDIEVNGSLLLNENATLRLENTQLNLLQTHDEECNMTFLDCSSLEVENATVHSNYAFTIYFRNNSTAVADKFTTPTALARVYAYDSSILDLNSFSARYLRTFNSSIVNLFNSAPYYLRSYGDSTFDIVNSTIQKQYSFDSSQVTVTQTDYVIDLRTYNHSTFHACDSRIEALLTYNGSTCVLVNSTYNSKQIVDQSKVYVWWYLDAHVIDSIGQDIPSANVTVSYPNATISKSQLANGDGWARSTLMEKWMNATGEYPVGNYTVDATFGIHTASESVSMTGNQQVTLQLSFVIPELSSPTILILSILAVSLAALIWEERRRNRLVQMS
jgi:hypothetical protein